MENVKHCAVVVRDNQDIWEGTRTALGLAAHNYWSYLFVLDTKVEMTIFNGNVVHQTHR